METSPSTLNPFAVSYVPLAKREVQDATCKDGKTTPKKGDAQPGAGVGVPHLQEMESILMDEEAEMDLAYLQMIFPGVSDQSLADVYNVNLGDLEAAVDMLSELEFVEGIPECVSPGECSSVKAAAVESSNHSGSGSSAVKAK